MSIENALDAYICGFRHDALSSSPSLSVDRDTIEPKVDLPAAIVEPGDQAGLVDNSDIGTRFDDYR